MVRTRSVGQAIGGLSPENWPTVEDLLDVNFGAIVSDLRGITRGVLSPRSLGDLSGYWASTDPAVVGRKRAPGRPAAPAEVRRQLAAERALEARRELERLQLVERERAAKAAREAEVVALLAKMSRCPSCKRATSGPAWAVVNGLTRWIVWCVPCETYGVVAHIGDRVPLVEGPDRVPDTWGSVRPGVGL